MVAFRYLARNKIDTESDKFTAIYYVSFLKHERVIGAKRTHTNRWRFTLAFRDHPLKKYAYDIDTCIHIT